MATTLITGTSKGIGMATALSFGRAGHQVAATMRSPEKATELSRIIKSENLPIRVYSMDVDNDASVIHYDRGNYEGVGSNRCFDQQCWN